MILKDSEGDKKDDKLEELVTVLFFRPKYDMHIVIGLAGTSWIRTFC